jgi:hypothetical protein
VALLLASLIRVVLHVFLFGLREAALSVPASQYRARQKTEQDRPEGDHQPADKTRAHHNGMHDYRSTSAPWVRVVLMGHSTHKDHKVSKRMMTSSATL